jgi:hypothetical protein
VQTKCGLSIFQSKSDSTYRVKALASSVYLFAGMEFLGKVLKEREEATALRG